MNKKLKATAAVCAAVMALTAASVTASANYSCADTDDGKTTTYTWDFAEYAGDNAIKRTSDTDSKQYKYSGLTLGIDSKNDDNEKISDAGVAWKGPSLSYSNGNAGNAVSNGRYITYTPEYDGTLTVDFTSVTGVARIYISTETDTQKGTSCMVKNNYVAQNAVSSAGGSATVTAENVKAGNTYYIWSYDKDGSSTVSVSTKITKVTYVADTVQSFTFDTTAGAVSDKTLYVTVGDKTESKKLSELLTTTASGEAELKLGIDFTYTTGREITAAYIQ